MSTTYSYQKEGLKLTFASDNEEWINLIDKLIRALIDADKYRKISEMPIEKVLDGQRYHRL